MAGQDLFDPIRMGKCDLQDAAVVADDDPFPIDLMDDRIAVAIDAVFRFFLLLIMNDDVFIKNRRTEAVLSFIDVVDEVLVDLLDET